MLRTPGATNDFFTFEAKSGGPELTGGRLTVSVVAVDGVKPAMDVSAGVTLLAVSSGFATAEALARLALVAADAGQSIDGIIVVNPDPGDGTVGVVPSAGEARQLHRYRATYQTLSGWWGTRSERTGSCEWCRWGEPQVRYRRGRSVR